MPKKEDFSRRDSKGKYLQTIISSTFLFTWPWKNMYRKSCFLVPLPFPLLSTQCSPPSTLTPRRDIGPVPPFKTPPAPTGQRPPHRPRLSTRTTTRTTTPTLQPIPCPLSPPPTPHARRRLRPNRPRPTTSGMAQAYIFSTTTTTGTSPRPTRGTKTRMRRSTKGTMFA